MHIFSLQICNKIIIVAPNICDSFSKHFANPFLQGPPRTGVGSPKDSHLPRENPALLGPGTAVTGLRAPVPGWQPG